MGAINDAIKLYGPDFSRVHGLYSELGYCYSDPEMLALARPCNSQKPKLWIPKEEADAWWVEIVVGKNALRHLYEHIPFSLNLIGWSREFNGKPQPRFYNFHKLKEKINNG